MNDLVRNHDISGASAHPAPFATPAIDVFEGERDFRVDVDLPGVRADEVQVSLEGGELSIEAMRPGDRAPDGQALRYRRSVRFDRPLDADAVTAHLEGGVLALTLPKATQALPRQIPVVAG